MTLTLRERTQLAELLDLLQTSLTVGIFQHTNNGTKPAPRGFRGSVARARRARRKAVEWRDRLQAGR